MGELPGHFWEKVDRSGPCWLWLASCDNYGYGQFQVKTSDGRWQPRKAHILTYEEKHGPVPEGKILDHIVCNTPRCVNPDHVAPTLRGRNASRTARERIYCPHGHTITDSNVYVHPKTGYHSCLTCRRARNRKQEVPYGQRILAR